MRISRSERAWTSSAAVEADDIVRLAQLALVPVDGFSSPVSALNTLSTCSKEKKNCYIGPLPTESANMQSWHCRTRLENGEGVEEAVAALHSIKEQS